MLAQQLIQPHQIIVRIAVSIVQQRIIGFIDRSAFPEFSAQPKLCCFVCSIIQIGRFNTAHFEFVDSPKHQIGEIILFAPDTIQRQLL